jgi:hypothetical protein
MHTQLEVKKVKHMERYTTLDALHFVEAVSFTELCVNKTASRRPGLASPSNHSTDASQEFTHPK